VSKRLVLLMLAVIVIAGALAFGSVRATPRPVAAAHPPARQAESMCVPASVAVFSDRIHVECINGTSAFRYFAAPVNSPNAASFLTALTTAMSSIPIMELRIGYYDDTTSGPPFGCSASDCRKIAYVIVGLKEGAPIN
jgi:hypothetical protein